MMGEKMKVIKRNRFSAFLLILGILLFVYAISLIVPFLWALTASFKDRIDFAINPFGLPETWHFENYSLIFSMFNVPILQNTASVGFFGLVGNSVIYAVGCAFFATVTPCFTAYAVAKFNYKFSRILYGIVIFTMILPIVGSTPSSITMLRNMGLYDTFAGVFLLKTHFLGTYFLVFHTAFKGIPKDFFDAARVDGAGNFTILIRIVLPLIRNLFFTIMLLYFVQFWNDFNTPLIYMPDHPTLALGIFTMDNLNSNEFHVPLRLASCMLALLPVLILFLLFHNKLMGQINMGGLKE